MRGRGRRTERNVDIGASGCVVGSGEGGEWGGGGQLSSGERVAALRRGWRRATGWRGGHVDAEADGATAGARSTYCT